MATVPRMRTQVGGSGRAVRSGAVRAVRTVGSGLAQDLGRTSTIVKVVLSVQVVTLVVMAGIVAVQYRPWSIDEAAHFDYVHHVAVEHRLPVVGEDRIHDEALAIGVGRYPGPSGLGSPPGIVGMSYEAFQPPLYYLVVAPAWLVSSDHVTKLHAIRVVGVGFLLATVFVLLLVCRLVFGSDWPRALAFALPALLAPGLVLRSATIGNGALEPLVVAVFVLAVILTWKRWTHRWLLAAAVALAACLLTRLVLGYLVPIFVVTALVLWWRTARSWTGTVKTIVVGMVPVGLVLPWLLFNRRHFDAWTGSVPARALQAGIINPTGEDLGIAHVLRALPDMADFFTPQEWGTFLSRSPGVPAIGAVVVVVMIPLAVILMVASGRRAFRGPGSVLCLVPLPLAVGALGISTVTADWPQMLPRYVVGALPLFAVGVFGVYRTVLPDARAFDRFVAVLAALAVVGLVVPIWAAFVDHAWPGVP